MADSHFVGRAKALCAERMGRIEQAEEEIRKLQAEVAKLHGEVEMICAVARFDDPDADMEAVKPIRRRAVSNGSAGARGGINGAGGRTKAGLVRSELPTLAMNALRDATGPMSVRDIASQIVVKRPDLDETMIRGRVSTFLNQHMKRILSGEQARRPAPGPSTR